MHHVSEGVVKKPAEFPQGTQRIARINELYEPNTYMLEPAPEQPEHSTAAVESPMTDAELACAIVGDGDAPVAMHRMKRVTNAYKTETIVIRPILTVT
jgi:hypothetical protein